MILNKKIPAIIIHAFLWCTFILLPVLTFPEPLELLTGNTFYLVNYIATSIVSILFFYFNYNWAIPKLYFLNKKWKYALSIISFLVITIFIFIGVLLLSNIQINETHRQSFILFRGIVIKFIILFAVAWLLKLFQITKQQEHEKDIAELANLKAQINPHFLFNTLNGLYALAIKKSDKTAESISQLSELMRYVITDAKADRVTLEKEIEYIQNYIELNRLRLTGNTRVNFMIEGNLIGKMIEPLLLISFIENAFKYGVSTEHKSTIEITISIEGQDLQLMVKNDKVSRNALSNEIGIKNTIKRLDLSYRKNYQLEVKDEPDTYQVNLRLHLK
jgi:LytS/YehU family sensor histidine kinase